jgi:hypothetical protein
VTGLQVTTGTGALEVDANGQVFRRVLLTFDASPDILVQTRGALQVEYRRHDESADDWQRFPEEPGSAVAARLNLLAKTLYVLRVRWRNSIGTPSDWVYRAVLTDNGPGQEITRYIAFEAGPVNYSTVT